jgi:alkylhydroperoxidase/carboxymuconolactone decarboxylase family protein YurZ
MYPLSKQERFVTMVDQLQEISDDVGTAYRALRKAIDSYGTLDGKQIHLCLLAGFASTRNEAGFRVHCTRAREAGASLADVEQTVLLMLGTSLGVAPVVEALHWARDELG